MDQSEALEGVLWFGVLLGVVLLAVISLLWFRKYARSDETGVALGLTLEDLRRQRDRGMLTAEEYERLRATVIRAVKAANGEAP